MTLPNLKKSNKIYLKETPAITELITDMKGVKSPAGFISQLQARLRNGSSLMVSLIVLGALFLTLFGINKAPTLISPLVNPLHPLTQTQIKNNGHEVFGFAPYWTIDKLNNVDYNVLTTLSYFGVPVNADGSFDKTDPGYITFQSKKATEVFKKAHSNSTRVVLTITQMDNDTLDAFLTNPQAQTTAVNEAVNTVKNRGIDGINVDFEYVGNPGQDERDAFSLFVKNLTAKMHQEVPSSRVTVSVYASAATSPRLDDITALAQNSDGIFMMAYDFAVAGSDTAQPTAPLYGKKEGKYSYDVSTAVDDFLARMPASKLILGVPYYGYNYVVYKPGVDVPTRPTSWKGSSTAQTIEYADANVQAEQSGWDDVGKVGWKAYYDADAGTWRVLFQDDARSLSLKYDFAKDKNLGGVGIWALGFDNGTNDLWAVLENKFGKKQIADSQIISRAILDTE
jgi:spore germination protein YaaH